MSKNANCLDCDYYYKLISGSVTIEGVCIAGNGEKSDLRLAYPLRPEQIYYKSIGGFCQCQTRV